MGMDAEKLETREQAAIETVAPPCAGFWLRAVALLVDGAILSIGFLVLTAIVAFFETQAPWESLHLQLGRIAIALLGIVLYAVVATSRTGQTPGKACVGIRVETLAGGIPAAGTVLIRYLAFGLFALLSELYLGLADGAFLALRRDKRSLHDLLAGTVVRRVAPRRTGVVVVVGLLALALCHSPVGVAALSERFLYDTVDTPAWRPGGQKAPEALPLMPGDVPVINRLAYRLHPPRLGDLALCASNLLIEGAANEPDVPDVFSFVHVIGVPGDTLSVHDGHVNSTNLFLDEDILVAESVTWPSGGGEVTVPQGMVAVLEDCGYMMPGLLPRDALRGPVVSIVWPPSRMRVFPCPQLASDRHPAPPLWLRLNPWPLSLPGHGVGVPNVDWR
jgi:uncharacterized RDD family membrane protein YckC